MHTAKLQSKKRCVQKYCSHKTLKTEKAIPKLQRTNETLQSKNSPIASLKTISKVQRNGAINHYKTKHIPTSQVSLKHVENLI